MALSRDIYRELEDVVGPENMSEDLAVIDGYAYQRFGEVMVPREEGRFTPRPDAVVLPGSTKEVQAIIKFCNRRGLKSKASSTGYGPFNTLGGNGGILLDLRRMNRILEIDEKNMYVVVEPYVTFAQVQAEAMKRGLNCHVIGAGSNTSYLASHTSVGGNNTQAISQGASSRNLLGVEWVTPSGEIVTLGSQGSGAGWFSGDGPGPSLRGIIRGAGGALGGLGVFTKCAGHLHPWPGPTKLEIKRRSPEYEAEIPPNFEYHVLEWPTWEQCADAEYKIAEAGIAFALHKTAGPGSHGSIVTSSNNEYYEKRQAGKFLMPRVSLALVMAASTPEEHAFQVKVLDKILEESGGKISPIGEEPTFKKRDFINMVRSSLIPRLAFRLTGSFTVDGMLGMDTIEHCAMGLKMDERIKEKYSAKGAILDDGTYNTWGVVWEGGHFAHYECGHQFDPGDEKSRQYTGEMIEEGMQTVLSVPFAIAGMAFGDLSKVVGPLCYNFPDWLRKIKKTFDPNNVSDATTYIPPE